MERRRDTSARRWSFIDGFTRAFARHLRIFVVFVCIVGVISAKKGKKKAEATEAAAPEVAPSIAISKETVAGKSFDAAVKDALGGNVSPLVAKVKEVIVSTTGVDASLLDNGAVQITIMTCLTLLLLSHSKIFLWLRGIAFLLLSNESKGLSKALDSNDVRPSKSGGQTQAEMESKIIVFIRHGESDWNYIFNKNKLLLLPRLVLGLIRETFMFSNSLFIDSPLSLEGVAQAKQLQTAIQNNQGANSHPDTEEIMKALRGDPDAQDAVLVSSNLRRAVATGCIALWPRLRETKKKVKILSSLQEMSRNVDTNALAGKKEIPDAGIVAQTLGKQFQANKFLDASESGGNKAMRSRALPRMDEFCNWCFKQPEPIIIVSSGHSLWFKNFFKAFIPKKAKGHHATSHKMVNCGVVAFKLEKGSNLYDPKKPYFKVDDKSILTVYGGFEKCKVETTRSSEAMFVPQVEEPKQEEKSGALQAARRLSRRASEIFVGAPKDDEAMKKASTIASVSSSTSNGANQQVKPPAHDSKAEVDEGRNECSCSLL